MSCIFIEYARYKTYFLNKFQNSFTYVGELIIWDTYVNVNVYRLHNYFLVPRNCIIIRAHHRYTDEFYILYNKKTCGTTNDNNPLQWAVEL